MNLASRIIPGALNNANKDAIDWNSHGLLAYGCQSTIVILDSQTFRVFQCLEKNFDFIVRIKWASNNFYHNFEDQYALKLASVDTTGNIVIWDVYKGIYQCEFRDGNKSVSDLIWYSSEQNPNLLLTVHTPNIVTLWNTQTATKIWRIVYDQDRTREPENFHQIVQDPFNHQRAILLGQSSLMFIEDFSPIVTPTGQTRRFFISNSNNNKNNTNSMFNNPKRTLSNNSQSTTRLKTFNDVNEASKQDENSNSVSFNDCIQILFHPLHRHMILIVYPREILIFDLQILQTIGNITCEKSSAAFYKIYACSRRDQLICFHESGTVSVRNRRIENNAIEALQSSNYIVTDFLIDFTYETSFYTDAFRLVKNTRICAFCVSPKNETELSVVLTDGKVLFWSLDHELLNKSTKIESKDEPTHGQRIPLNGLMLSTPGGPFVIQMCPPMTAKNCREWKPHLALGCSNGDIVVLDLNEGTIQRQLAVHSCSVRGIVWLSSEIVLSWAYQIPSDGRATVRNELFLLHLLSGKQEPFRSEINSEESPIERIKVSHTKNYLIILFREQPFEIWDAKNFSLIRRLPKKCPRILALDWSPNVPSAQRAIGEMNPFTKTRLNSSTESEQEIHRSFHETESISAEFEKKSSKENFIFTDEYNLLYHFYVDGRTVKEVATVPPDHSSSAATDLVLKGDFLLSGDVDGFLQVLNIRQKQNKSYNTKRGLIRKLRFAPGKGNFRAFVLYNDGIDIWDIRDRDRISSLKFPRETIQSSDAEWASPDRVVIACSDNCLRIYETNLIHTITSMEFQTFPKRKFSSCLINGKIVNLLKHLLCIHKGPISDLLKKCSDPNVVTLLEKELNKIDPETERNLLNCETTIDRCLFVAKMFDDCWEERFWRLVRFYLDPQKSNCENLLVSDDLFLDKKRFEENQLERTIRRDIKSCSSSSLLSCIDSYIVLGQKDRAVQLLLESDPSHESYALNCIKACLISSEKPKNTVTKLVATNLIANGKLDEGVQLLCTIDLCAEACRYLQDHHQWERSIWLSKLRLKPDSNEFLDLVKRWSDFVRSHSPTSKIQSALILISSGQIRRSIDVLHKLAATELAMRLFVCAKQFLIDDGTLEQKIFDDYVDLMESFGFRSIADDYQTTVVVEKQ